MIENKLHDGGLIVYQRSQIRKKQSPQAGAPMMKIGARAPVFIIGASAGDILQITFDMCATFILLHRFSSCSEMLHLPVQKCKNCSVIVVVLVKLLQQGKEKCTILKAKVIEVHLCPLAENE